MERSQPGRTHEPRGRCDKLPANERSTCRSKARVTALDASNAAMEATSERVTGVDAAIEAESEHVRRVPRAGERDERARASVNTALPQR